jgi:AcrR family transcriptional regulator
MADSGEASGAVVDSGEGLGVDLQPLFRKLKPGPGMPAEQVLADQRRRLQGAMIAVVDTAGWSGVRVRTLARTAGVSTATFYKHFANADECLASTYDAVMAMAVRHSAAAQRRQSDWQGSLRAAVGTLMEDLAGEPRAARLALLDVFAAGPSARKRIGRAVTELERLVGASFAEAPRSVTAPRHLVAGMTAGMLRVARTTTMAGRGDELPGLTDQLGDWMLSLPHPEVLSLLAAPAGIESGRMRREPTPFPAIGEPDRDRRGATDDDRQRLLRAAVKLAAVDGFASLTAPKLRTEAGVSRRRFEASFESVDECFLEAVEMLAGDAAARAGSWSGGAGEWERRTCRFVLALCAQAARNRAQARLAFLGIFVAGRAGLLKRERMVGRTAAELRDTVPAERRPSAIAAEASVAAVWHIAQSDIAAGRARNLPAVAPLLSYVVLAPIVGAQTAAVAVQAEIGAAVPSRVS